MKIKQTAKLVKLPKEDEHWKPIEGFEGYDISSLGRVRSWKYTNPPNLLKQFKVGPGYLSVGLRKNNKTYHQLVHKLIAKYFIENKDNKSCINHKDENKTNNSIENLEWCTQAENISFYYLKHHDEKKCPVCKGYLIHKNKLISFYKKEQK